MPHQLWNIVCAVSERRHLNRKYFQTIIEVFAKRPLFHHRGQIPMRCRYQAHVNLVRTVAAKSLEFLLLQNAQQFRLKFQRYVSNLIKKKRAVIGEFEPPRFLGDRARKCSLFVAE